MKIDFEFDSKHGVFKDALNLPDDYAFTDEEIETMKQRRFDQWIAIIENPPIKPLAAEEPVTGE